MSPLALIAIKRRRAPIWYVRVLCPLWGAQLVRESNVSLFPRRHLHNFNGHRPHVKMVVAPEQAQRTRLQHIHVVRPVQLHLAYPIAQVMGIRNHNLVHWPVLEPRRTLGRQLDTPQRATVREDGGGQEALHPRLCVSRLGQLNREPVMPFCGGRDETRTDQRYYFTQLAGLEKCLVMILNTYGRRESPFRWLGNTFRAVVAGNCSVPRHPSWCRSPTNCGQWRRPTVTEHGTPCTHNCQSYTWSNGQPWNADTMDTGEPRRDTCHWCCRWTI